MPNLDPTAAKRIAAALALMDQAMKQFSDTFNAGEHYPDALVTMEAVGREILRTAYRDAPELIEWLPDMYANLDKTNILFAYRSNDDEAVRKAHERLTAESIEQLPHAGF